MYVLCMYISVEGGSFRCENIFLFRDVCINCRTGVKGHACTASSLQAGMPCARMHVMDGQVQLKVNERFTHMQFVVIDGPWPNTCACMHIYIHTRTAHTHKRKISKLWA